METLPLIRVLAVLPDERDLADLRDALAASSEPVEAGFAASIEEAATSLGSVPFDFILTALELPDGKGQKIGGRFPSVNLLVLGNPQDRAAIDEALVHGAVDYFIRKEGWASEVGPALHKLKRLSYRLSTELNHAAKRYEDLVEAIPDVVYELDPDGHFTFLNQAVATLGYKPSDLVGKHFSTLLFEEDVPHVSREQILPLYLRNKTGARNAPKLFDERRGLDRKTENLEIRIKRRDGTPIREGGVIASVISYGEIASAGAYRSVDGLKDKAFVGTVGIIRDISLRRKSEDMLRKMYQAVDQSPTAVAILNRDLLIEYVNPAFFSMTGSNPDRSIGCKISEYIGEGSDRARYDDLVSSVRAGIDWRGEIRCPRIGADPFWSSTLLSAIRSPSGLITHYLCLMEDVTRKRTLDDLLKQAKTDAEDASRMKSEFLANISMQLRTPLAGVVSQAEILLSESSPSGQSDRLHSIHSSSRILMSMLNDLLDLSKIEARALELNPEDFRLADLTSTILEDHRIVAEDKGLKFELFIEDGGFPVICADKGRIAQIISNLVSNAVKYTPEGRVDVRLSIRARDNIPALFVSVRDTGIGISGNDQQKLFKHFSQVDASVSQRFGGTGLGLAISKELALKLGGDIWVESSPGVGSTFTFFVPVSAPDNGLESTEITIKAPRPFNILIAEDNPVNQDRLRFLLEKAGHHVEIASDGYAAIAILEKGDFDIVLMDLQMPGLDGIAATAAIRSYSGGAYDPSIPVIALPSVGHEKIDGGYERAGFDGHAVKPVNAQLLVSLIDETIRTKVRFDLGRLKLQYAASVDEFRRLLMIASQDLPKRVTHFGERNAAEDLDGAKNELNGIVNILSSLGALRALKLVKRYRDSAKTGDPAMRTLIAEDIKQECTVIRKLVKKALDEL